MQREKRRKRWWFF
uniref:Uncharacterized protein n=1 Tax=Nymphaea colorata TaxID=210225 RepID=A0A5K0W7V8_9MAGN